MHHSPNSTVTLVAKAVISILSLSSLIGMSSFVSAQETAQEDDIETIVVTSRNRVETLQEVPTAVTAFTEGTIEKAGIQRVGDFLQLTSNVTFASSESAGVNFMTIRGVSQVRNGESPVAVVIDGVLMTDPGQFDQELVDIMRIEVLKGPQGALYGRNAIGGAINITTKQAINEFEGKVNLGAGNGGRTKVQGLVSFPLGQDAAVRLSGSQTDSDGLINNSFLGEKVDPYEDRSFRARLNWYATDALDVDLRVSSSKTEGGALNFVLQESCGETNGCFSGDGQFIANAADDTSTEITASRIGSNTREITNTSLKLDYTFPSVKLTSITAWTDQEEFYAADAYPYDCGPVCAPSELRIFNTAFGPIPLDSNQLVKVITQVETTSQEFRLTSTDNTAFRWIVGAYFLKTERLRGLPTELDNGQPYSKDFFTENTLFGFADDNDNTAYALFAQTNYDVTDKVEASLALRYDNDKREQTDVAPISFSSTTGTVRTEEYSELQPKLTVRYLPSKHHNLFATISRGFRSGGFNQNGIGIAAANAGINGVNDNYDKEVSTNIEFGFKSVFLNQKLKVGGGVFFTELENQHFFQFIGAINAQLINNIDEVKLQGLELDAQYRATNDLTFYTAFGLTDSEIEQYTVNPMHVGNSAPYVARTTFNTGLQYTPNIGNNLNGLLRVDYERRGKQYWDTANSSARSALNLLNLRVGIEAEGAWSIHAWAKNLNNEIYNAEYVIGGIAQIATPRTYGVDFSYRF